MFEFEVEIKKKEHEDLMAKRAEIHDLKVKLFQKALASVSLFITLNFNKWVFQFESSGSLFWNHSSLHKKQVVQNSEPELSNWDTTLFNI